MLELEKVNKSYGNLHAVVDVSFQLAPGEILGILGLNGVGKTSLIKILSGVHYPDSGRVSLDGVKMDEDPLYLKKRIGYLPEESAFYHDIQVDEYLDFAASAHGLKGSVRKKRVDTLIEELDLRDVYRRPMRRLSKGYLRRVGLGQALIHDPQVLVLDEPSTGLDPQQLSRVRELIRQRAREKAVILSTHILDEAQKLCTRLLLMNGGRLTEIKSGGGEQGDANAQKSYQLRLRAGETGSAISEDQLRRQIEMEPSFESASFNQENGSWSIDIRLRPDREGADIFHWVCRQGYVLLELRKKSTSLENIFLRMTGHSHE